MSFDSTGGNIDHLLAELHEKRRWLDAMIESLETARRSPEHQLLSLAERALGEEAEGIPRADLGPDVQRQLATLAEKVNPGRRAKPRSSG